MTISQRTSLLPSAPAIDASPHVYSWLIPSDLPARQELLSLATELGITVDIQEQPWPQRHRGRKVKLLLVNVRKSELRAPDFVSIVDQWLETRGWFY